MSNGFEDHQVDLLAEKVQGDRAKALLCDEAFLSSVDNMKAALLQAWADTPMQGVKEREFLWMQIKAVESMVKNLVSMVDTGKMASMQVEEEDKKFLKRMKEKIFD